MIYRIFFENPCKSELFPCILEVNREFSENMILSKAVGRTCDHETVNIFLGKANYREMPAFVELGRRYGADRIYFSKITNWGTFSQSEFRGQCVWRKDHKENGPFRAVMTHPALSANDVDLGNLSSFLPAKAGPAPELSPAAQ